MTFKFEEDRVVIKCIDGDIERGSDGVIEDHVWNNLQDNFRTLQAFNTISEYYGG